MIGKLEELVLLGCMRVGKDALPSAVYAVMSSGKKELASFSSIYTTLGRLAKRGLLAETEIVDRQGRTRRSFTITGAGQAALAEAVNATRDLGGLSLPGGAYA